MTKLRGRSPAHSEELAAYVSRPEVLRDDGVAAERVTVVRRPTRRPPERRHSSGAFRNDEDHPGAAQVAILSADLWRTRYEADPTVVGRLICINGSSASVVG